MFFIIAASKPKGANHCKAGQMRTIAHLVNIIGPNARLKARVLTTILSSKPGFQRLHPGNDK